MPERLGCAAEAIKQPSNGVAGRLSNLASFDLLKS